MGFLNFIGHLNNFIGIGTLILSFMIWWRVRRIRNTRPEKVGEEIVVVFDIQNNAEKLAADLVDKGFDAPTLIIEARDCLPGNGRANLDREFDDFEKLIRHFFEKIGRYRSSEILLAYRGPAALSFAIGRLCANNYNIVQLHHDNNIYQRPPSPTADWRHWSAL